VPTAERLPSFIRTDRSDGTRGAATAKAEFGSPLATTRYQLGTYDAAGETIAAATAPAGGTCNGRPCWRESASGFRFRGPTGSVNGRRRSAVKLTLKAGVDGKARISAPARRNQPGSFTDRAD
jgi:hypothetical protein